MATGDYLSYQFTSLPTEIQSSVSTSSTPLAFDETLKQFQLQTSDFALVGGPYTFELKVSLFVNSDEAATFIDTINLIIIDPNNPITYPEAYLDDLNENQSDEEEEIYEELTEFQVFLESFSLVQKVSPFFFSPLREAIIYKNT